MENRWIALQRRVALYHRHLRNGVEPELAAEYLAQILSDEAELRAIGDGGSVEIDGANPSYLRSRACLYRDLADRERDPERADLFRKLAATFDRDAGMIEPCAFSITRRPPLSSANRGRP